MLYTPLLCPSLTSYCLISGSFCNCLLPESIQATQVANLPDVEMCSGKFYKIPLDDIYKLYHAVHHLLVMRLKCLKILGYSHAARMKINKQH